MDWTSWAILPLTAVVIWILSAGMASSFPTLRGKRILVLIAHPDDEAMFFSPSIIGLTQPHFGNHVRILCLSDGNADGLGQIRRKEIVRSGMLLGLRAPEDVGIIISKDFPDSMTKRWDEAKIVELLRENFARDVAKGKGNGEVKAGIDVIITFDREGVSGHPNHVSLYDGARAFVSQLQKGRTGWEPPVKLYTLPSVGIARKYASIVDVPMTVLSSLLGKKKGGEYPDPLVFVSGMGQYRRGQRAMTEAHKSQMRWFRWGWIGISRYMVVNDLRKQNNS